MSGYEHLVIRVLSRVFVGFLLLLIIFGVRWRNWNPFRVTMRLFSEARHAIPPGGRIRLAKMTETFLSEVGVLLLVFPMLDKFISSGQLSPRYVVYSFVAAIGFYSVAAMLAVYTGEQS